MSSSTRSFHLVLYVQKLVKNFQKLNFLQIFQHSSEYMGFYGKDCWESTSIPHYVPVPLSERTSDLNFFQNFTQLSREKFFLQLRLFFSNDWDNSNTKAESIFNRSPNMHKKLENLKNTDWKMNKYIVLLCVSYFQLIFQISPFFKNFQFFNRCCWVFLIFCECMMLRKTSENGFSFCITPYILKIF